MAKNSFRKRFIFWLDLCKDDEFKLAEEIETLKKKRIYTKLIRDGLNLILDLRAGKTDMLIELFPWIADYFQVPFDKSVSTETNYLAIKRQIDRLEELLQSGTNPTFSSTNNVIPVTDTQSESSIKVTKAKSSGNSAQNFLNSMSIFN